VRILFVGDVIGKPGRRILARTLPRLVDEHGADYVVVNVENAAGGFGVTADVLSELGELPIHCMTSGNHIWDKKEVGDLFDREPRLLRPANYPDGNPGRGVHVGECANGTPVATVNLEGQVFMRQLDSPFRVAERVLAGLDPGVRIVLVDFHAEATSEKQALGLFLDGRVSAVLGTHTHVPTADERILAGGTAFQTDLGMTGPFDSIIGMDREAVMKRFLTGMPTRFEVAQHDVRLCGLLVDIDNWSGHAIEVTRIMEPWQG
jgi:metallophosphoesterase (TIGR00282 family)